MARPARSLLDDGGSDAPVSIPAKVRLTAPHGFIDENSRHRYWNAGEVVGDAAEVALLINRGAPVEPVE